MTGALLLAAFARSGSKLGRKRAGSPAARVSATAADHDGTTATFGGVRLADVLHEAGVPIDTTQRRCAPLLADARNGLALAGPTGPLRIVAPCDRTHARWVHGVTSLTVVIAS